MAAGSQDLIFRFLGIDAGAGHEFDRMAGKASTFGSVGSKALLGLGAAAAVVAVESVKAASNFQSAMELIHTQAGASQEEVNKLSTAVLGLAGATATAPEELAKGLYHLESTGLRGAAAMNALRIAAEGAKVGQADLEDVTNALNAVIASGIKGASNLTQAMGALNATVGAGDMRMQDLAEALGTGVLAVVKGFGLSLRDVGAALAVFGDNNIRGADAATQLRMSVLFLAQGTVKADAVLGKIGLTTKQLRDDLASGGLNKALTDLHVHLIAAGDTGAKMGNVLLEAFGKKAGVGLSVLESQFTRFQQKFEEVHRGAKNFQSDWTATTQTFAFHMQQIRAEAEAASVYIGTYLIKGINGAFTAVGDLTKGVEASVGWLRQNEIVVSALAVALGRMLVPALVAAAKWAATDVYTRLGVAFLTAADGATTLTWRLRFMGAAAVASKLALYGLGIVAVQAFLDLAHGDKVVKGLQSTLSKPLAGNVLGQLASESNDASHALYQLNHMSDWSAFTTGLLHPVNAIRILTGSTTDGINNVQDSISTAYGSFSDLVHALHGFPTPMAEQQTALVIKQMGLSAKDLATKDWPGLLARVREWIVANQQAHAPAEQASADITALGSNALSAADDVKALKDALDQLAGKALSADEAAISFRNNIVAMDKALKHSHGSLSLNSQAGRDARQAFDTAAQSAIDLANGIKDSTGSTDRARASLHQSIKALQANAGSSDVAKAAIGRLKDAYNQLGPSAVTATNRATAAIRNHAGAAHGAASVVGENLGAGLVAGMQAKMGAVTTEAKILADQAVKSMRLAAQVQSPSRATAYIGRMIAQGLIAGWTGEAGRIRSLLGTDVENALNALTSRVLTILNRQRGVLKAAQSQLHQDLASRRGDTASLAGSIAGPADLAGAFTQDAFGNTVLGNVASFAQGQVAGLQRFAQDLAAARKLGLNATDLTQIANMGANQGDQILQQLLGSGQIQALNSAQAQIARYSTSAASTVEGAAYAGRLGADRRSIHEQTVTLHAIERHLHAIERHAASDVARHVTITVDSKGKLKLSNEDGREIVRELRALAKQGIKP